MKGKKFLWPLSRGGGGKSGQATKERIFFRLPLAQLKQKHTEISAWKITGYVQYMMEYYEEIRVGRKMLSDKFHIFWKLFIACDIVGRKNITVGRRIGTHCFLHSLYRTTTLHGIGMIKFTPEPGVSIQLQGDQINMAV